MPVHTIGDKRSFETFDRNDGPTGPMIDPVNGGIVESRLKPCRILAEIVKQARDLGFFFRAERGGKNASKCSHVSQVVGQRLPCLFWQAIAISILRRVRIEFRSHQISLCRSVGKHFA